MGSGSDTVDAIRFALGRERLAVWLFVALLTAASVGIGFLATPYEAPADEVRAVHENPAVTVTEVDGGYLLTRSDGGGADGEDATGGSGNSDATNATDLADAGLVFYPGARVAPDAYLPVFAPVVARTGLTVFVPRVRLNLAILDPGAASPLVGSLRGAAAVDRNASAGAFAPDPAVRAARGRVDAWYVGGHSLGGVGACRYAHANPERVAGVVLFASYCDRDVSDAGRALAVTGSADVILDREAFRANRDRLPADATVVSVEGMNHTQFGSYRGQRGDAPAPLAYETAHERLREILVGFLRGT